MTTVKDSVCEMELDETRKRESFIYEGRSYYFLQSYKSRERKEPLNGDGFGVGWYAPQSSPTPCIFTSITPAWNNQNLRRLSEHVKSSCFFAHVRAASPGMRVCETNCHPFQTIFMVTHNPENAALAHRIVNIRDGRMFDESNVGQSAE